MALRMIGWFSCSLGGMCERSFGSANTRSGSKGGLGFSFLSFSSSLRASSGVFAVPPQPASGSTSAAAANTAHASLAPCPTLRDPAPMEKSFQVFR